MVFLDLGFHLIWLSKIACCKGEERERVRECISSEGETQDEKVNSRFVIFGEHALMFEDMDGGFETWNLYLT